MLLKTFFFNSLTSINFFHQRKNQVYIDWYLNSHDGGCHHIETSLLICRANQWTGFYLITASVMKELMKNFSAEPFQHIETKAGVQSNIIHLPSQSKGTESIFEIFLFKVGNFSLTSANLYQVHYISIKDNIQSKTSCKKSNCQYLNRIEKIGR